MREFGAKRIATQDGFVLELHDSQPIASSLAGSGVQVPPTGKPDPASDDDEDEEEKALDAEEREELNLRKEWKAFWTRKTLSSGAGIPPFPGVESARRRLGA